MTSPAVMPQAPVATRIDSVAIGVARDFTRPGSRSAIDKRVVQGPLHVGVEGLQGDEQGDRRVHGGPDKAIHHYPRDHYAAWRNELGAHALLDAAGAFGENLSSTGLTEATVCLGDRFTLGTAVVEVSQLRQPCWKLSDRFGVRDMARRVQETGRTGWYYRVLQPGVVASGDMLALQERPHAQWSLSRVQQVLYARDVDVVAITELLQLPLVPSWQALFERRLQRSEVESWGRRLTGLDD
ncbi:MOSC domain-containing protein [Xanthomonas vesicatoria]|uniref:MOSC domain-containing protein n=1 Tax=Xanthomonas vesicatoria TaxID=56460 RepID=A0AAJ0J252_9XANT|nr:MOSC domain-containing protein [Xanthomonas vesicatoria]APO93778.1 MOSC domain-containing protein [Xanthomonas vesicatoria]KHM96246.1 molybdenum cofactor sulfurase [Xanthomonas vesicatoria]KHM98104.1 molybdenum cofactor sulfurase [Xanthomonas vesicatoria]MCC8623646.1 MOSC domain-containing protein [Xanthomonas vesicatoria]MCC8628758.1 MOSC domain-containing protein [Xanthomonas vesicatoria]